MFSGDEGGAVRLARANVIRQLDKCAAAKVEATVDAGYETIGWYLALPGIIPLETGGVRYNAYTHSLYATLVAHGDSPPRPN